MKITHLLFSALAVAAVNAGAGELPSATSLKPVGVHAESRLVFDCSPERLPSLRAVGALLDTNNGSKIYAERGHLVLTGHRECRRGAARVVFFRDPIDVPMHAVAVVSQ